ncbi:helix-turn-helix domain-containing protein [Bradyrhizobium sp. C9]|uniref:helix-turn-helix domain-containing protein n=1 Tax=Bradyrhizobium sp. C9 TaxID=142585 RepID=UPI001304164D|nr:helix-turn-helix domain-containing protein [Bradyrhizobium sp. C9]
MSGKRGAADMAGVSIVESVDANDYAGRMNGWNMRMDQVSSGRFTGRLVMIRLRGLEIVRETTTQALLKQGSAWPDALVFSLPLEISNPGYYNGRPLEFPQLLLSDGANLLPLLTSTRVDVVSVAVARDRLFSCLDALGETRAADFIAGLRGQQHFFSGPVLAGLQYGLRRLCDQGERLGPALAFEHVRRSLQDTVVGALADVLSENDWTDVRGSTAQKQTVDRIREYVFERVEDPPRIAELCRHVGVSRRTLQGCFQDALGLTPLQYLRMLRLNAVRRELRALAATGQPVSIGDVAARWGFWHWSRFTENYRQLFGELPSHTVQRVASASR